MGTLFAAPEQKSMHVCVRVCMCVLLLCYEKRSMERVWGMVNILIFFSPPALGMVCYELGMMRLLFAAHISKIAQCVYACLSVCVCVCVCVCVGGGGGGGGF